MEPKQVIVMRRFKPGLRRGKEIAQGAHASVRATLADATYDPATRTLTLQLDEVTETWLIERSKKVCVYVETEEALLEVHARAQAAGVRCALIQDAGLTEFGGVPTYTAVAVGPDLAERVDAITGALPLY